MKYIQFFVVLVCLVLCSCQETIDLYPQSNLNTGTYYRTVDEVRVGLTGCYNGMQAPLQTEWQLTELRSDNSKQGVPASTSSNNRDLSDLDMFLPATIHSAIYSYWLTTYNNIRNANIILQRLGVVYDPSAGAISLQNIDIKISDTDRKQLAGEALFIRSYHYFNLVRLYGGVFLLHTPVSAAEARAINRSSVADVYKLIEADLKTATTYLNPAKFAQITGSSIGRANQWAAKALLGKVYLTLNRKAEAAILLQDVVTNSGFSLLPAYANVFSVTNEMNAEILFTVRYKAGGLGLGSGFGNSFAALNSGSAIINGSGQGLNYPTTELNTLFTTRDNRRPVNIATFGTGTAARLYVPKYLSPVVLSNDGESDWPIIRFADVQLMLAEAQGFRPESIGLINQVRARAGLPALAATVNSVATFEQALAEERRLELAFENHRYFDLMRYNTTLTTIKAVDVLRNHFAAEYASHYAQYPVPILTLPELQANVTEQKLLLPIPQREIDTNPSLNITQNAGY
ncbi:RagB/SusD family nutrient uptake outer membrane protein [Rudanella lutea]|uniref:RagB/SusD family nutrient uptake outer membrane protein n=1 Tax=Rudanella lutea TaxID=451374 RepID=UPI00035C5D0E|nr:RagB/SusD family nutrient uptake outer membrane protein [Rudanella lutea]